MITEKRPVDIAVLIGSLRKESLSRKMAQALMRIAPQALRLTIVDLGNLLMYNEDLDTEAPPEEWQRFRQQIKAVEGVLSITPEYNRSVPAVLKNAVDIGSAPHGQNVFNAKPAAIISLSPGKMGAFGANHHLRQSLVFLNMPILQQPEAYIGGSEALFDEHGAICSEGTQSFLQAVLSAFADWVAKFCEDSLPTEN